MKYVGLIAFAAIALVVGLFAVQAAAAGTFPVGLNSNYAPTSGAVTAQVAPSAAGGVQRTSGTIHMSIVDRIYSPNQIRVRKGDVVRIEGDASTFTGCMGTLVIGGYNIRKTITANDNVVEFTADKAGTFAMSCPMGMGAGQLLVEDESGNVPAAPDTAAPARGMSCGLGGGGCGCGGR